MVQRVHLVEGYLQDDWCLYLFSILFGSVILEFEAIFS